MKTEVSNYSGIQFSDEDVRKIQKIQMNSFIKLSRNHVMSLKTKII